MQHSNNEEEGALSNAKLQHNFLAGRDDQVVVSEYSVSLVRGPLLSTVVCQQPIVTSTGWITTICIVYAIIFLFFFFFFFFFFTT